MKLKSILISTGIVVVYLILVILGYFNSGEGAINRIFKGMGGDISGGGYIQIFTLWIFCLGIMEILDKVGSVKREKKFLRHSLLPSEEHIVFGVDEVNNIRVKVNDYLKSKSDDDIRNFYLLRMIKSVCTKFRANKSVSETLEIVNIQSRINLAKTESGQSIIKYIAWAIPSIGFIGTVLGIAQALEVANQSVDIVTSTLAIAFDTTLFSLILSLIYMWYFHILQEDNEILHSEIEEFVINQLVNKIDVS
ncbi:MAG: MotA/TolQ/ExbB proton channel family protein [Algoriphagus sp.]|uniref:MotA/TolQ/ExbB proton channel family protein n=1 Tax=Algoriphagus sp. TaxID=1872435 RepID=UPI00262A7931|nr:MotA/TolQ/ExbB proton channel family protein [Algoriphagus sp.]MDG1279298.1 MotA/TolQ/ExbB proton channel family protein [Algoriphagus sp.]